MKELDFLPPSYHQAQKRRRQHRHNMLLSIIMIAALAVLHQVNQHRISTAEATLAMVHNDVASFQNACRLLQNLNDSKTTLAAQASLMDELTNNAPLDAIIGEIVAVMGNNTAIRGMDVAVVLPTEKARAEQANQPNTQEPQNGTVGTNTIRSKPSVTSRRGTLHTRLTGIADSEMDVGVFFGRLTACPLCEHLRMTYSRESQLNGRPVREFELNFDIKRVEFAP